MLYRADTGAPAPRAGRPYKRLIVDAAGLSFFINLLMLTSPIYAMQMFDRVLSSRSVETLVAITLIAVVLFAAMAAVDFAKMAMLARAADAFERAHRETAFNHGLNTGRGAPSLAAQPMKDLRQIKTFLSSPALGALLDVPWTPLFLVVIFLIHWLLGVTAVLGLIATVAIALANERSSAAVSRAAQAAADESERVAAETIRNISAVDSMGMRAAARARWLAVSDIASENMTHTVDTIASYSAAAKAFRLFMQSAVLGVGALLVISSAISPGAMFAVSIVAGRALAPVEMITAQWRIFAQARESWKRLRAVIETADPGAPRMALPAPTGALRVDRLYCQPAGAVRPVVKAVSFALQAGEALGVIGPSGSGKSTLARAIVGAERIVSGEVRLDGADLRQFRSEDVGRRIGYLPQTIELFSGTAAANIARLQPNPDPAAIVAAAQLAGAHDMILGFPNGYDTEIGEGGMFLSAGQRQRLGLARALYGEVRLVVLDEPNANLDAEGESALSAALNRLKSLGVTTIVVAHRPSAVAHVDTLLLLINGEIKALGPRADVLAKIAPAQVTRLVRTADQSRDNG